MFFFRWFNIWKKQPEKLGKTRSSTLAESRNSRLEASQDQKPAEWVPKVRLDLVGHKSEITVSSQAEQPRLGPADEAQENRGQSKQRWEGCFGIRRFWSSSRSETLLWKAAAMTRLKALKKATPSPMSRLDSRLLLGGCGCQERSQLCAWIQMQQPTSRAWPPPLSCLRTLMENDVAGWLVAWGLWFSSVGNFSLLGWGRD